MPFDIQHPPEPTLDECKAAITAAINRAATITQAEIDAGESRPGAYVGTWVSLEAPAGYEAWCDTPGVLDIEVPPALSAELCAWVEANGVRCGVEVSRGRHTLFANTRLAPVPPAPEGGE